jgi:hypothetical protein
MTPVVNEEDGTGASRDTSNSWMARACASAAAHRAHDWVWARASRAIPLGIVVVAVGLGLMSIVSIAGGSPEVGVGLGGAIVVVGAAFVAIGLLARMHSAEGPAPPPPLPPDTRDPSM